MQYEDSFAFNLINFLNTSYVLHSSYMYRMIVIFAKVKKIIENDEWISKLYNMFILKYLYHESINQLK